MTKEEAYSLKIGDIFLSTGWEYVPEELYKVTSIHRWESPDGNTMEKESLHFMLCDVDGAVKGNTIVSYNYYDEMSLTNAAGEHHYVIIRRAFSIIDDEEEML
jgi:hypothetical protein